MTFEQLKPWLDLAQWAFTVGLGLFVWLRKPGEDASAAVQALRNDHDQRLHQHGQRLTEIEAHMEHMPTDEELKELQGAVREIAAGIAPMRASLTRIEDYLLHNGSKATR